MLGEMIDPPDFKVADPGIQRFIQSVAPGGKTWFDVLMYTPPAPQSGSTSDKVMEWLRKNQMGVLLGSGALLIVALLKRR